MLIIESFDIYTFIFLFLRKIFSLLNLLIFISFFANTKETLAFHNSTCQAQIQKTDIFIVADLILKSF